MTNPSDISLPGPNDGNGHPHGPGVQAAGAVGSVSVETASPPEPDESPPEPDESVAAEPRDAPAAVAPAITAPPAEPPTPSDAVPQFPAAPQPPAPAPAPVRRYRLAGDQIKRLVVLAVTIVLLGTGGGLLGALIWPPTYAARAEILYPISQDEPTGFLREDRNLTTQLVLLQGRAVLGPVAQAQGRVVEDDLEDDVTVEVLETSEVIQVEARHSSPEEAMTTLQAIVDRYFELERAAAPSGAREYLDRELADLRADMADARGRVLQLQGEVDAGLAASADLASANDELQTLISREGDIQSQLDDLNMANASGPNARLLTTAYPVPDPVSPQPLLAGGAGTLLGLVVAAGAVAVTARRWIRN